MYVDIVILSLIMIWRKDKPAPRTVHRLRQRSTTISVYRALQTLQIGFNFCFKSWMFPSHKFVLLNAAVLGTYGAIKLHGPRGIIMGVTAIMALLYLSIMFKNLGNLHERSEKTLNSWKYDTNKIMRRFLRSSPTIHAEVGYFYGVKRTTVVVIWGTVFNFATNMLLSF